MELSTSLIQFHPTKHEFSSTSSNRAHSNRILSVAMSPSHDYNIKSSSSSSTTTNSIPKMEPFNRSRITRSIREPSLIEKAEHAISGLNFISPNCLLEYKFASLINILASWVWSEHFFYDIPLLQVTQKWYCTCIDLLDRCSILEGDEAYKYWEALFEFENMKVSIQNISYCH